MVALGYLVSGLVLGLVPVPVVELFVVVLSVVG